ncbi:hypothetical protein [Calothrix sp. PCC 7507]|uniref:hypothetical protein n=1 Tax=Calothrix sp. PCC 7507 TaxID=99598 RepID=UPI00030F1F35|nr:hypothetical protein [Calothrix sp. PCC 7507]
MFGSALGKDVLNLCCEITGDRIFHEISSYCQAIAFLSSAVKSQAIAFFRGYQAIVRRSLF